MTGGTDDKATAAAEGALEQSPIQPERTRRRRKLTLYLGIPLLFHVLGFVSSINAVMSTRTSQGAVAWAIFLNTFPYVAVPSYWVLGRSRFQGYVTARQEVQGRVARMTEDERDSIAMYTPRGDSRQSPSLLPARRLTGMPYLSGNDVELLVDGDRTFASILDGIDRSRDYVLFQFFIVKDDEIGQEVKRRLIAKAGEGVRVYFLYDEIGSHALPARYLQDLRDAGVVATAFHTRKGPRNRFQVNFRNHRKVVVVDGKEAWVGGHNVGDEYLGRDPRFSRWRDTHLRIQGPAALAVQLSFAEDWFWATDALPEFRWTPEPAPDADVHVMVVPSGPADPLETATLLFTQAINSAKERLWIASPYFVPDEGVMNALLLAGLRGVDVRILIPDEPDHMAAYLAAFTYAARTGQTGVKFYRYTDGFMHQKVLLQDHTLAAVGTANFDNRSFRLNFEITAVVADSTFVDQVEGMLEADLAQSTPMPPEILWQKPFWFRLAANVARLTAPLQ